MCLPVSRLFWVLSLAYPNLLGTKGYVVVVVNPVGMVVAAGVNFLMSPQHVEATACVKGLEHTSLLGMRRIILEIDVTVIC
jgi:hypothetical protein